MPPMVMLHAEDPRDVVKKELGDIASVEIFNTQVLVAVYERPERTAGGIILADQTRGEDKIQGKVGLIVKMGPDAFHDPEQKWFRGVDMNIGDWVVFRPSDGWPVTINKKICRVLEDTHIRLRVDRPDRVW